MIDVVIPAHKKDVDTLDLCIDFIKTSVIDKIDNIYVISNEKMTDKAIWVPESSWQFSKDDIASYIGTHRRTGWYYQQLLKLTIFDNIEGCAENVLICDSDTFFVRPVKFLENDKMCLSMSYDTPPGVYNPYFEFMDKLIPGLKRQSLFAGICHHIMVNKSISSNLKKDVEKNHNQDFWKACMSLIVTDYKSSNVTTKHFLETGNGQGRISEYELLFNYYLKYCKDKIQIRPLKQILAYKESLGMEGFLTHTIGSRTNLDGNIHLFSKKDLENFKFDNIEQAFKYIGLMAAQRGWDTITFQRHTRLGSGK